MIQNIRISAIAAIDEKRGMGKDGGIPWHIPGEQKRFKEITTPHPMIMGRKTFESIGKILPDRPHIIVSRDPQYRVEGAIVVTSVQESIEKAKEIELNRIEDLLATSYQLPTTENEVFIIGGGQIFQDSLQYIDRIYLTVAAHDFACDTFFPDYPEFTKVIEKKEHTEWEYPYVYLTLEK